MMSKKNMLILAGLAIGGVGVASMLAEGAGDGGENIAEKIKQRAGRVLGSAGETKTTTTTTGGEQAGYTKKDIFGGQPDVFFAAFPTDEDVFGQDPVVEAQDKTVSKKGQQIYGGLPVPTHYPKDVVSFAEKQHKPEAFLRGLRQEQANIAHLSSHPTLTLSPGGKIVSRTKKQALPSGAESAVASIQRGFISRTTGIPTTIKTSTPTPKKKIVTARAATPGRMGMGKSYAKAHGGE